MKPTRWAQKPVEQWNKGPLINCLGYIPGIIKVFLGVFSRVVQKINTKNGQGLEKKTWHRDPKLYALVFSGNPPKITIHLQLVDIPQKNIRLIWWPLKSCTLLSWMVFSFLTSFRISQKKTHLSHFEVFFLKATISAQWTPHSSNEKFVKVQGPTM